MRRWDRLLDAYLSEYEGRGRCADRNKQVRRELVRWGEWLKTRRPRPKLEEVDAELIVKYLRERGNFKAKATLSGTMSVLRGMGEWIVREGHWQQNPLRWLRGPKLDPFARAPRRIGTEEMELLWQQASRSRTKLHRHVWLTTLSLLYGLGLRRGELQRLDVGDWNEAEDLLLVDGRKTGRQRQLVVPPLVGRCLASYLPVRQNHLEELGLSGEPALLVNRYGERLSGSAISHGIHALARRAQVKLVSLHQFRHTCASDLLEAGARLPEVQQILGHQGVGTTMRYLHLSDPQRREAITRHPLNDWLKGEAA